MENLERRLDLQAVVAISISSMLGSGIFVLPGIAIAETGPSVWLSYLLAALCVLPAAMSKCELATAMPSSGGTYVYLERTFGPFAGILAGISLWLSLLLKSAFALVGISAYLAVISNIDFMGMKIDVPLKVAAISLLMVIVGLNIVGVGKVGAAMVAIVSVSLIGLGIIGGLGTIHFDFQLMTPFQPHGIGGLLSSAGLVFVSFAGVTKVAAIAEEIKRPEKNLPLGILLSLTIVTSIYVGLTFILVGNIPFSNLVGDLKPMHTLAEHIGGATLGFGAALLAILTMASMANSGVLAASRFPFAMSRDMLIPGLFGKISLKFLTPWVSICASGLVVGLSILYLDVAKIAKLASAVILTIYILENIAVVVLRETRVQWYKPNFKSPFYPYLQIFGFVSGIFLLLGMGAIVAKAIAAVVIPGVILYLTYSRSRTKRKGVVGVRVRRKELESAPYMIHSGEFQDAKVAVSLFGRERSPELLVEIAASLADGRKMEVVHLTEVPEQMELHGLDDLDTPAVISLKRRVQAMSTKTGANIEFDHLPSHDIYKTVHEISSRLSCEWLVKEWGGRTGGAFTIHNQMGWLENHLNCHIMTVRDAGIRYFAKVMLLTERGGLTNDLVLSTGKHLAAINDAELWLTVCLPSNADEKEKAKILAKVEQTRESCPPNTQILTIEREARLEAILDAAADFDLLVMRSQTVARTRERLFGTAQDKIIERATCTVVCIREHQSSGRAW